MAEKHIITVVLDANDQEGRLKGIGGSQSDRWNNMLANQLGQVLRARNVSAEEQDERLSAAIAGLMGVAPADDLEGMMAVQLIAAHNAAMDCYRRAVHPEQTFEGQREYLAQANKLSRTFSTLLEALNHHRGKGQQKVTVEHVHVPSGGQAVVGMVEGGGGQTKLEGQSHARPIAHAPQSTMRGADAARERLSAGGDGERSLPNARRNSRGTQG